MIFSLGVFSSCRFLPRPMLRRAVVPVDRPFCVSLGDARAFSPWAMGFPYGVGQLLVAGILVYASREVRDEG